MTDEEAHLTRRERRLAAERAQVKPTRSTSMEASPTAAVPLGPLWTQAARPVIIEQPSQPAESSAAAAATVAEAAAPPANPRPELVAPAAWDLPDDLTPVLAPLDVPWDTMPEAAAGPEPGTLDLTLGWQDQPATDSDPDVLEKAQKTEKLSRKERKAHRHATRRWWRPIVEFLVIVLCAALAAAVLKSVAFRTFEVPSESMDPALMTNDRIVVELISPHFHPYERGDVVVFKDPDDWIGDGTDADEQPNFLQLLGVLPESTGYLVKRILAAPGETIEGLADGTLLINGKVFKDTYAPLSPQEPFTWTLSDGQYWVMGDNRPGSADSRLHGPVGEDKFIGRVAFRFYPFDRLGALD